MPTSSPHLFTGFVPALGVTLVLAPPLLGSLDLAASFALAAGQGRDHFVASCPEFCPSSHFERDPRTEPDFAFHPVLFATHHRPRVESFFERHPIGTLKKTLTAPILYCQPPAFDADPAEALAALKLHLDQLAEHTQQFAATLAAAAARTEPDPSADPFNPPNRPIGNPVLILTPLLSGRILAGNGTLSTCANFTKLLADFAAQHQITIIAFIDCGSSPRNLAGTLNAALAFPGVDAILSLAADPATHENRILSCHAARGMRSQPEILFAPLMEPRLGVGLTCRAPIARLITPNPAAHRARVNAVEWLSSYLDNDDNLRAVPEIVAAANAQGISRSALYRARYTLRLVNRPGEDSQSGYSWHRESNPIDTFTHRYIEGLNHHFRQERDAQAQQRAQQTPSPAAASSNPSPNSSPNPSPNPSPSPTTALIAALPATASPTAPSPLVSALPPPAPAPTPSPSPNPSPNPNPTSTLALAPAVTPTLPTQPTQTTKSTESTESQSHHPTHSHILHHPPGTRAA